MSKNHRLFRTLVLVGLVAAAAKCFRLRAWKMAGGPKGEFPPRHWHKFHGHKPPWLQDWEKPSVDETEVSEPPADVATAWA
jgi:hypothetical protein